MGGYILHQGLTAMCAHGGSVSASPSGQRVKVGGQPVTVQTDMFSISACPFTIPPPTTPQPCIQVKWMTAATRVKVGGQPVLLQDSSGQGVSAQQVPQGPPSIVSTQMRVKGS